MKKTTDFLIFILAKVIAKKYYKNIYLQGRYFSNGIHSVGWKLVIKSWYLNKLNNSNKRVPWPVSHKIVIVKPENIIFDPNDLHIFQTYGTYFQALKGKIYIGAGTYIAPNVGLITTNHDLKNLSIHLDGKDIKIGKKCWIGMNSVILPGIELGEGTIVGAGSIVTKSFPEGKCIIAGNPARKIKEY